jgi:ADP-ribose pyrophosphatase YjhB (NUDIX family)
MSADPRYVVNVEAAIYRGDRWLLVRRSEQEVHAGGTLSLIGGKVEDAVVADAVLEDTLRREVREEVGVEVEAAIHYTESKSFFADDGDPVVDVVFTCRHAAGEPRALDPAEVAAVHWMTAEVEAHPDAPPWTRRSVQLAERLRRRLDVRP